MSGLAGDGGPVEAAVEPETIDGSFVPVVRKGVAGVDVDGEVVVLDPANPSSSYQLNRMGSALWNRFDGSCTLDEVADRVGHGSSMAPERVRAEAIEFTRQVARLGLLGGAGARTPGRGGPDRRGATVGQGEGRADAPQLLAEPPSP